MNTMKCTSKLLVIALALLACLAMVGRGLSQDAPATATTTERPFSLNEREKIRIEILRSVRDSAQQRLSMFDDIAVTTAVTLLPSLILAMWYARAKEDKPVAVRIYQTLPFLIAFFGAFILQTRTMAFKHDSTLTTVQERLASSLGYHDWSDLVPEPPVNKRLVMTVRSTFYGIGMAILGTIYVWSAIKAHEKQLKADDQHCRIVAGVVSALHVAVIVGLLGEVAYVASLW